MLTAAIAQTPIPSDLEIAIRSLSAGEQRTYPNIAAPLFCLATDGYRIRQQRRTSLRNSPWFADGGYAGQKLSDMLKGCVDWTIEIILQLGKAEGFAVLPRRSVAERAFAWLERSRWSAKS
ncbi:MAG: transposase [Pseudomonadota bacterium]